MALAEEALRQYDRPHLRLVVPSLTMRFGKTIIDRVERDAVAAESAHRTMQLLGDALAVELQEIHAFDERMSTQKRQLSTGEEALYENTRLRIGLNARAIRGAVRDYRDRIDRSTQHSVGILLEHARVDHDYRELALRGASFEFGWNRGVPAYLFTAESDGKHVVFGNMQEAVKDHGMDRMAGDPLKSKMPTGRFPTVNESLSFLRAIARGTEFQFGTAQK